MNANDGNRTGNGWTNQAPGTRRGARRLARFPGSGGIVKWIRPRVWNMVALACSSRDTRDWPGHGASAEGHEKTAAPVRGRAVSGSWYHPTLRPHRKRPPQPARRDNARCGSSVTEPIRPAGRPPPPTEADGHHACSERSSKVFFAGIPGPASQRPRFSCPFPPVTRPRHGFGMQLCVHPSSVRVTRQ